jgi:CDP-glucose 4,6-dehydratase
MEPLSGYLMLGKRLYEHDVDFVGPWNFGPNSDSFMTVERLASEAIGMLGRGKVDIRPDTTKHEAHTLRLDITKAKALLGWEPQFDFRQNLQATFDWYRNYYERIEDVETFTNRQIGDFFNK